jgi:hypothetical protein
MRKILALGVLLLAASSIAMGQYGVPSRRSEQGQQARSLNGSITDKNDNPVAHAVVYLKNTKTLTVKTFIAGQDGTYRFNALSPNVDYEVHAELRGKTSDTKTLSSFDSRPDPRINLKIDMR